MEVVLAQYEATNEGDFARAMSYYDDDVELVVHEEWLETGVARGREAVGRWFGNWFSLAREARFDVREARALEDGSVLLVADHHARGRASGAQFHGTVVWLYRLRDGRIVRVESFPSPEEALAAAGQKA